MKLGLLVLGGIAAAVGIVAATSGTAHAAPVPAPGPNPNPNPNPGPSPKQGPSKAPEGSDPRSKGPQPAAPAGLTAAEIIAAAQAAAAKIHAGEVPGVPAAAPSNKTPQQVAAEELELHLKALGPKDRPDPVVVMAYQKTKGLKQDGSYGPATALALAADLQRRPPEPRVWPKGVYIETSRKTYYSRLAQIVTVANAKP